MDNKNLDELNELVWSQFKEDRELILSQYQEIRSMASREH